MDKPLDLNEPVRTRDGRAARVICTDRKSSNGYSIMALVTNDIGTETALTYRSDGTCIAGRQADLVNIPKHKFTNLYSSGLWGPPNDSLEKARSCAQLNSGRRYKGVLEETTDGEFVAFHPAKPE